MTDFATILHGLRSPVNVGAIVRTHVAMGGGPLVMVGLEQPWKFGKRSQAFSRKLESLCEITYLGEDDALFGWCETERWTPVAIEIRPEASSLPELIWPERVALVFGNERVGLSDPFLARCSAVARIPQFGPVASLNVAISHGMATLEVQRSRRTSALAVAGKYPQIPPPGGET